MSTRDFLFVFIFWYLHKYIFDLSDVSNVKAKKPILLCIYHCYRVSKPCLILEYRYEWGRRCLQYIKRMSITSSKRFPINIDSSFFLFKAFCSWKEKEYCPKVATCLVVYNINNLHYIFYAIYFSIFTTKLTYLWLTIQKEKVFGQYREVWCWNTNMKPQKDTWLQFIKIYKSTIDLK